MADDTQAVAKQVVESTKDIPQLVAALRVPEVLAAVKTFDPQMGARLSGAASAAGVTPLGTLLGAAVGLAVTRWGLGWDQNTQAEVVGVCILGGGYVAHWVKIWLAQIAAKKAGEKNA